MVATIDIKIDSSNSNDNVANDRAYKLCLWQAKGDRGLRTLASHQLEPFKLTLMQWLLLRTTVAAPRQRLTMTDAANLLNVTLPQITALAGGLTGPGYLIQRVNSRDRRSRQLVATAKGRRLADKAERQLEATLRPALAGLTSRDWQGYQRVISALADSGGDKGNY